MKNYNVVTFQKEAKMKSYKSLDRALAATIDKFHDENDEFLLANSKSLDAQICIAAAKLWQLRAGRTIENACEIAKERFYKLYR